jgi:hypothetical protein
LNGFAPPGFFGDRIVDEVDRLCVLVSYDLLVAMNGGRYSVEGKGHDTLLHLAEALELEWLLARVSMCLVLFI